ncbi:MAG: ABC transporter permease [Candidatus Binatia bacterium]
MSSTAQYATRLRLLWRFALDGLAGQKRRSILTVLGIAIGTASVVGVVSVGLLGREYIIDQIEGVGANLIFAYSDDEGTSPDEVTFDDVAALARRAVGVAAMAPVLEDDQTLTVHDRPQRISVLGTTPSYLQVRNLVMESGRFYSAQEEASRDKVCVLSHDLARKLYGTTRVRNRWLRLYALRFRVLGVYREAVSSAAAVQRSEAAGLTAIIPFATLRSLSGIRWVHVVYVQAERPDLVPLAVQSIHATLRARHRPAASFKVKSLQGYLDIAKRITNAITWGLMGVAGISLVVGGIGIMNIMLVSVTERTKDIGIRLSVGARPRDILIQFLFEAVILALSGGVLGVAVGTVLPAYVGMLYGVHVPISPASAAIAFSVSVLVGLFFGYYPARKAARMNLVDSLRYE